MVKGVSKRVIVIKSPDRRIFDEAIFIVREDVSAKVTGDDIIKEAQTVAGTYVKTHIKKGLFSRLSPPLAALCGAGMTAAVWALFQFVF